MQSLIDKEFEVKCIGINNYAKGVCKIDSFICFVDDLYPDEIAKVKIYKKEKNLAYAKVIEFVKTSEYRIPPVCNHSIDSGSCPFNDITYEYELELKKQIVKNNIERTLKIDIGNINITSGDRISGYRNKVTVFFSLDESNEPFFGSFIEKTNKLVRISSCVQIDSEFISIVNTLLRLIKKYDLEIADFINKNGYVKGVSIRKSEYTNKISIMILSRKDYKEFKEISSLLASCFNNITGISVSIDNSFDTFIYSGIEHVYFGTPEIEEKLLNVVYKVSNKSFLQVNTSCASKLYERAITLANINKNDTVLDLYSGAGGISLNASKYSKMVYGVEEVSDAVDNAKYNASFNNIKNVKFYVGDAKDYRSLIGNTKIDVLFVDPPRTGIKKEVINNILNDNIETIIYISCDSFTLARDLKLLSSKYAIKIVEAFNMFPRTKHVEVIAVINKKTA